MKQRGIYEKLLGSDVWWIRYVDAQGRYRREKAGSKSMAIDLYRKRKTEALHTFASKLVMGDVDIRTAAESMGHKSIQMAMRYAHLAPDHKLVAVERLAGYTS